jgi:predicted dehydrogenase
MKKKLKVAIAGAGLIAQKKHLPAFRKARARAEVVAIADLNRELAAKVATQFGIPRTYSDPTEMLEKERPDLLDICTPPRTHAVLAREGARHGCHLLIEKPMALTVSECDEIIQACRQAGTQVCVAHSDLFYPPVIKARQLVANGAVGRVLGMRILLSTPAWYMTAVRDHWAHRLPGGVIGETGPHVAYLTLAFIKEIRDVDVTALKLLDYPWSRFEDYRIELRGNGAACSAMLSYAGSQWAAKVDILGSEALLTLDLEALTLIRYKRPLLKPMPVGLATLKESLGILGSTLLLASGWLCGRYKSTHDRLVADFLRSIVSGGPPPVPGEEGREAVRVLGMIVERLESKYPESGKLVGADGARTEG